jgi:hypothetical protein
MSNEGLWIDTTLTPIKSRLTIPFKKGNLHEIFVELVWLNESIPAPDKPPKIVLILVLNWPRHAYFRRFRIFFRIQ